MENKSFTIALTGNPNVGKTTVFNSITGLNQHTGNWSGKTVEVCSGEYKKDKRIHNIIDLPGSYSVYAESEEEVVTKEFIESGVYDVLIVIADANALERNLTFALQILMKTQKVVLCLNMIDIAEKNGCYIDTDELSLQLGVPVITSDAKRKKGISALMKTAIDIAQGNVKTHKIKDISELNKTDDAIELMQKLSEKCRRIKDLTVKTVKTDSDYNNKLDKIFTSKLTGIPIMLAFLFGLFWITAYGANYPSDLLSSVFSYLINSVYLLLKDFCVPEIIASFLCDGVLKTTAWVVSVMLPPALIFFPLFALLEDFGYLPRVAFNLDGIFNKAGSTGKQALTMMMGFGCNACGVVGCRIMNTKAERNIAMLTNSFIPCNGRIPMLITLSAILLAPSYGSNSLMISLVMVGLLMLSVAITLLVSKFISHFNNKASSLIMELPSYKKPSIIKTVALSIKNKVLSVLWRAVMVALPAGAVIWMLANIDISGVSLLKYITEFLDPLGKAIGVDGTVITAFILGFPANEIVIPVMLMSYTSGNSLADITSLSSFAQLLSENGWSNITAICTLILCIFHFPCSTTCITIYKETKSLWTTLLSIIIPMLIGLILCFSINQVYQIFF